MIKTRGVPTISALLSATSIIGLNQHYGIATLVGEAGGENECSRDLYTAVVVIYSCNRDLQL